MEVMEPTFIYAGNPLQQRRPSVGAGRGKTAAPPVSLGKENLKGATQQVHHQCPILRIV
jgi:lysozyme family protein